MSMKTILAAGPRDAHGHQNEFHVEQNGRIRLIIAERNHAVLIGHWNEREGLLVLFRNRANWGTYSFTTGLQLELWTLFRDRLKNVILHERSTGTFLWTSAAMFRTFGYEAPPRHTVAQLYRFLDREHWTEAVNMDDAIEAVENSLVPANEHRGEPRPPLR